MILLGKKRIAKFSIGNDDKDYEALVNNPLVKVEKEALFTSFNDANIVVYYRDLRPNSNINEKELNLEDKKNAP